ncbi:MAG: copper homeostasis protein CutC [Ferruginibacter sp.]
MNYRLEIIAFNIESIAVIEAAGAHRIELCDNPAEGGTTPSYGMLKKAREKTSLPLFPIIRPRGGDFLYCDDEFDIMKTDIKCCRELGMDGVVTGILLKDGNVDTERCKKLVALAYPMGLTFHRAIDRTNNIFEALEKIIELGFERVLTSGGFPNVDEGTANLEAMVKQADDRIIIMPGSELRSSNITAIAKQTGAVEFHSSAKASQKSLMAFNNLSMKEQLVQTRVDAGEIKAMLAGLAALK